jgi:hypothetical protein
MMILIACQAVYAGDILNVCIDYHCEQLQQVPLQDHDRHELLQPFSQPAKSAAQERENIRRAIARFEQLTGSRTLTYKDLPENKGEDETGQLDCIAESKNTRHYLLWLEQKNQLKWHHVGNRIKRTPSFFDVHWGAVITETGSDNDFVVDSWYGANGEPPLIQPVDQWLRKTPALN